MTPLNGPALTAAVTALKRKHRACWESNKMPPCVSDCSCYHDAKTATTAYLSALPQSGVAARLLKYAALEDAWWANVGRKTVTELCADLRLAAAVLSGVELPGWRLLPVEPTEAWVHGLANLRHGRSLTPRCEPPTERDVEIAGELIGQVLAAAPPPPVTGDAPPGEQK